ncbi:MULTISPECIES: LGFP repeat-containing protein [Corynebacterium]|uniref:LGFP repeat-containing protein n=1 Tax=Corynebacterium TaxID=1716 RepID=UPI0008074ED0|nr:MULTISPECIES: LGFP repeat-containing protein [Corynebacterium]
MLAIILTAVLGASGLAAAGTQYLNTQGEGIGPVAVQNDSESFNSGTNVVVEDAAVTAQGEGGGARTVKEFQRDQQFSSFALTWTGKKDITAFVRAEQEDGTWSQWYDLEPMVNEDQGTNGTELIWHGPTNKIQVSTLNVDLFGADAAAADENGQDIPAVDAAEAAPAAEPAPAEAPVEEAPAPVAEPAPAAEPIAEPVADYSANDGLAPLPSNYGDIQPVADVDDGLNAVFIDGNADAGVGIANVADTDGMPKVISRAGWGANESLRCSNPTIDKDGVSAITIHHTAGSNNYTEAQAAAQVRGAYSYHAQTLGWCDIGYQSLVDKYGNIYEGRAGGMTNAVQGAHAGGFNQNTWAISMIGDYSYNAPPQETINAVGELAGWRAKVAGFDPTGTDTHYFEGTSYSKVPYGQSVNLPNIFAHRDVGYTACPGDAGYAQMGNIRQIAKAKYDSLQSGNTGGTTTAASTPKETSTSNAPSTTTPATTPKETSTSNAPSTTTAQPVTPAEPQQYSESDALAALLTGGSSGGTDLLNGANSEQLLTGLGSIAAVLIAASLADGGLNGLISNVGSNNGVPVLGDIKITDVIPIVDTVINLTGENKYSRGWNDLNNTLGPVLGAATGGETTVKYTSDQNSEVTFVPFENGIMVSSPEAGTHGLWGAIGDAWAQQGADLGPLGLPTSNQYQSGDLLRVDFQNGYITYDSATGQASIQLN